MIRQNQNTLPFFYYIPCPDITNKIIVGQNIDIVLEKAEIY